MQIVFEMMPFLGLVAIGSAGPYFLGKYLESRLANPTLVKNRIEPLEIYLSDSGVEFEKREVITCGEARCYMNELMGLYEESVKSA